MSDAPAPNRAEEGREYVLIKRGLYWRPNGQGYTGLLSEAGRYPADIAAAHEFNDGRSTRSMLASEATEFAPACWEETKLACRTKERDEAEARAAQAEAEVARLTAALAEANDRAGVRCPTNHAPTCQHCAAMPEIVAAAQALYEAERDHVMAGQEVAAMDHQLSLPQSVEAVQALLPARRAACESASSALKKRQAAQDAVGLSLLPLVRQDSSEKAQA